MPSSDNILYNDQNITTFHKCVTEEELMVYHNYRKPVEDFDAPYIFLNQGIFKRNVNLRESY